jgi:hypothetical protein
MHFNHDPACAARLEFGSIGCGTRVGDTEHQTEYHYREPTRAGLYFAQQWRGAFMNDILNDLNRVVRKEASREALTARACLPQTNT